MCPESHTQLYGITFLPSHLHHLPFPFWLPGPPFQVFWIERQAFGFPCALPATLSASAAMQQRDGEKEKKWVLPLCSWDYRFFWCGRKAALSWGFNSICGHCCCEMLWVWAEETGRWTGSKISLTRKGPFPVLRPEVEASLGAVSPHPCCPVLAFGLPLSLGLWRLEWGKKKPKKLTTSWVLLWVLASFPSQLATIHFLESLASCFMQSVHGFYLYRVGEPEWGVLTPCLQGWNHSHKWKKVTAFMKIVLLQWKYEVQCRFSNSRSVRRMVGIKDS